MLSTQDLFDIQQASRDSRGNLTLPARTIPVPASITPEAQKALAAPRIAPLPRWPPPDDKAAWRSQMPSRPRSSGDLSMRRWRRVIQATAVSDAGRLRLDDFT